MNRLDELASEHSLDARTTEVLRRLLDLLAVDEHAPTPIRDPGRAVDAHIGDSLSGLLAPEVRGATTIADLGAGVGFPGLALAAALPEARVILVESVGRKAGWLQRTADAVGLANVEVVNARAEQWPAGAEVADVVTARALAALPVLVEYAAPLLRAEGTLVAWKGDPAPEERIDGAAAAEHLGLVEWPEIVVPPSPAGDRRSLQRYRKVRATPPGFPRRPGIAAKKPLTRTTLQLLRHSSP